MGWTYLCKQCEHWNPIPIKQTKNHKFEFVYGIISTSYSDLWLASICIKRSALAIFSMLRNCKTGSFQHSISTIFWSNMIPVLYTFTWSDSARESPGNRCPSVPWFKWAKPHVQIGLGSSELDWFQWVSACGQHNAIHLGTTTSWKSGTEPDIAEVTSPCNIPLSRIF